MSQTEQAKNFEDDFFAGSEKKITKDLSKCLVVQRIHPDAKLPERCTKESAGYDLRAVSNFTINPRGRVLHKIGLKIRVPLGTYGRIAPKSGLALKSGIDVGAGVIDRDYPDEVGVVLFNHTDQAVKFEKGQKIAQLICESVVMADVTESDLDNTDSDRKGGFGSTGKF
jgi:dUTP pyrophosphatase